MGGTLPPSLSSHRHHLHSGPNLHTFVSDCAANLVLSFGVKMNIRSQFAPMIEEERGARRQTLIWKGVLHLDNQSTDVRVRNISATGAMIESSAPIRVGGELLLKLSDTVSIPASVEWTVGDQMGVSFHSPFDLALLAQARPVLVRPTWAPPTCDSAVQAAWERRLRRLSPAQLRAEFEGYVTD